MAINEDELDVHQIVILLYLWSSYFIIAALRGFLGQFSRL